MTFFLGVFLEIQHVFFFVHFCWDVHDFSLVTPLKSSFLDHSVLNERPSSFDMQFVERMNCGWSIGG